MSSTAQTSSQTSSEIKIVSFNQDNTPAHRAFKKALKNWKKGKGTSRTELRNTLELLSGDKQYTSVCHQIVEILQGKMGDDAAEVLKCAAGIVELLHEQGFGWDYADPAKSASAFARMEAEVERELNPA